MLAHCSRTSNSGYLGGERRQGRVDGAHRHEGGDRDEEARYVLDLRKMVGDVNAVAHGGPVQLQVVSCAVSAQFTSSRRWRMGSFEIMPSRPVWPIMSLYELILLCCMCFTMQKVAST